MKVLFAVNNDNISDAIVKKYQKLYREIVSYKNVYYYNAIIKELQNDKTYDRVVISEDLEPFANNNYDTIDKFLFEKLDKISDEATKANGEEIQIILICADRRNKSDDMLNKIFGIGIYNALIGDDRSIDSLCKLMNQPRNKKEAKLAYKIDGNNVGYQAEDENNVSEAEVQNILAHYKRLGKNEDKYVDSFNNIVSQYTDSQLRIIIRYLPLNVKAVLEERSPKYQQLSADSVKNNPGKYVPKTAKSLKEEEKIDVKMLKNEKNSITKPIVIPSTLSNKKVARLTGEPIKKNEKEEINILDKLEDKPEMLPPDNEKKGRGRPRKNPVENQIEENKPKRGRGRPKKIVDNVEQNTTEEIDENDEFDFDLFNMDSDENFDTNNNSQENKTAADEIDLFNLTEDENNNKENEKIEEYEDVEDDNDFDLFNLDTENKDNSYEDEQSEDSSEQDDDIDLFDIEDDETDNDDNSYEINDEDNSFEIPRIDDSSYEESSTDDNSYSVLDNEDIEEINNTSVEPIEKPHTNLEALLTSKKKIVSFVGTTKNGTSFVVNNLALMLASNDISCAILDMTSNKNSYYIYTNNEDNLRNIAEQSISNLENGIAKGIEVRKNFTVYTEIPNQGEKHENVDTILETLLEKHDIVLIDTDFNTDINYFEKSQEIYLVQSMDVLTIQPLTAFLRNLKSKGVLKEEKLRIVLNKWQKVGGLSEKVLIGGMSSYNDPAMSFMTELFDKNSIKYCKIPFEIQNNIKYLEYLVNCQISLKGYTKQLIASLDELTNVVYPRINEPKYSPLSSKKKSRMQFSDETNNTLNKMKNNY